MIASALTVLALGLAGQTLFFIGTQASYTRGDTGTPLRSMVLQSAVCLVLCGAAAAGATGEALLPLVAGGLRRRVTGGQHPPAAARRPRVRPVLVGADAVADARAHRRGALCSFLCTARRH